METITLSDFMNILDSFFETIVSYTQNGEVKYLQGQGAHVKLLHYAMLFIEDNNRDSDILPDSEDFNRKIFSGERALPRAFASYWLSHITCEPFRDYIDMLSDDAQDRLIAAFDKKGVILLQFDLAESVKDVLVGILERILNLNGLFHLDKVRVIGDTIYIGGRTHKLLPEITPPESIGEMEATYIEALLEVYAQHAGKNCGSLTKEDLNKDEYLLYREHLSIQRNDFYKVQTVFMRLRDAFFDGEDQFEIAKGEVLDFISDLFVGKKTGFDRVNECRQYVIQLVFQKSLFGNKNIRMMGNAEKRGMLHMLVNDGRIVWIKEGEYEKHAL